MSGPILISLAPHGLIQGVPGAQYSGVLPLPRPSRLAQDYRQPDAVTSGMVINSVVVVPAAGAAEQLMPGARVWLLKAQDGLKVWEGYSDAAGQYRATGLELGKSYVLVALDPAGQYKAAAAGPVIATIDGAAP